MIWTKEVVGQLEQQLKQAGVSNLESPFFDYSDERIRQSYEDLKQTVEPKAYERDTSSWDEIRNCVSGHISKYGDGALIILGGAGVHIWGAIPRLENHFRARYVSATCNKLEVDEPAEKDALTRFKGMTTEEAKKAAVESIAVQQKRQLGVARYLGYHTFEDFLADRKNKDAENLVFGAEETGLHDYYGGSKAESMYNVLLEFVKKNRPSSILYIHEGLCVNRARSSLEEKKQDLPRDRLFNWAVEQGVPVEFGAFGIREREAHRERELGYFRKDNLFDKDYS